MKPKIYLKDKDYNKETSEAYHYLITANGDFLVKNNAAFRATVEVNLATELDLEQEEESLEWKLLKIPFYQIQQALNFLRWAKQHHGTEALLKIYYNPANSNYKLEPPAQTVSCGYVASAEMVPPPDGYLLVGIMHSHPDNAFHSITDQRDEAKLDGMHITVGKLENAFPEFDVEIVVKGKRFKKKADEVLDYEMSVSQEWQDKVQPRSFMKSLRDIIGGKQ